MDEVPGPRAWLVKGPDEPGGRSLTGIGRTVTDSRRFPSTPRESVQGTRLGSGMKRVGIASIRRPLPALPGRPRVEAGTPDRGARWVGPCANGAAPGPPLPGMFRARSTGFPMRIPYRKARAWRARIGYRIDLPISAIHRSIDSANSGWLARRRDAVRCMARARASRRRRCSFNRCLATMASTRAFARAPEILSRSAMHHSPVTAQACALASKR